MTNKNLIKKTNKLIGIVLLFLILSIIFFIFLINDKTKESLYMIIMLFGCGVLIFLNNIIYSTNKFDVKNNMIMIFSYGFAIVSHIFRYYFYDYITPTLNRILFLFWMPPLLVGLFSTFLNFFTVNDILKYVHLKKIVKKYRNYTAKSEKVIKLLEDINKGLLKKLKDWGIKNGNNNVGKRQIKNKKR